jgi:hypothetical protein
LCDIDAELAAEAAQGVDSGRASTHPQRTGAMQALQRLLLDGLDPDGLNIGAACGFQ